MLAGWLNALVGQLLGAYIKPECLEKADYDFWGHYVILKGLELKPEAIFDLQLPIRLVRGYIGQITIRLPGLLGRSPVEVSVEQVFLLVETDYRHDGLWQDRRNDHLRRTKLAAADAALARVEKRRVELQKHRDGSGSAAAAAAVDRLDTGDMLPEGWVDAAAPPPTLLAGFLDKLRATVIENLQVQVRSLHIRWEDRQSNPSAPFAVGLTMELLRVETTNADWDPLDAEKPGGGGAGGRGVSGGGASGGPQRHVLKRLKVKNLAVYCQALPVDVSLPVHVDVPEDAGGSAEAERLVTSLFDHDISVCDVKNFARLFQECIPTRDMLQRLPGSAQQQQGAAGVQPLPAFETLRPGHPFERDLVLLPVDPEVRLQLSKHAASLSKPQRTIDVIVDGVALHVQVRQYEAVLALAAGFACYDARLRHAHLRPAQALRKLPHRAHDGAAPRAAADEKAAHSRIVRSWWRYAAVATLRDHAATRPGFRTRWSDLCDYRILRKAYVSLHQRSVAASEPPTAWRSERLRAFHRFQSRHHFADAETDWLHSARRHAVKHASRQQSASGVAVSAPSHPPPAGSNVSSSGPDSTSSSQGTSSDGSSLASPRVPRAPPVVDAATREARATANLLSWSDAALIRPLLHRSLLAFPYLGWARRYRAVWLRVVDAASSGSEGSASGESSDGDGRVAANSSCNHGPWEELECIMAESQPATPRAPRAGLNAQETVLLHYLETVLPLPDIILLRLVAQRQLRLEAASTDHERRVGLPTGAGGSGLAAPLARSQSARRRSNLHHAGPAHGPTHLEWHEEGDEEDTSHSDGSSFSSSSKGVDEVRRRGRAGRVAVAASIDASPLAAHVRGVAFAAAAATRVPRPVDSDCYDASDDELAEAGKAAAGGKPPGALQRGPQAHAQSSATTRPPSTDTPSRVSVTGAVRRQLSASAAPGALLRGADGEARASPTAHPHPSRPHHGRTRGTAARAPGAAAAGTVATGDVALTTGSRVTVSTTSSPPRGDEKPFAAPAQRMAPSESSNSLESDESSFKNPSEDSEDAPGSAPIEKKPLSSWFDFSWLWSDRGVVAPGSTSAQHGASASSSSAFAAASALGSRGRAAGAAVSRAHLERMRTSADPPPLEERERRMLEAQRREFFELIDYDPCEALEPYPKSYVHTHVSLQLSCFTIVLAHGGVGSSVIPLLYCQLRGLGVELLQRPSSFRYAILLSDLEVADATASSCEEFSRLLRKSPASAVSSVRRSESSGSFATHDGARTVTAQSELGLGGAQQASAQLLRVIYETFPSDAIAASAIAGGLGAGLQDMETGAPIDGAQPATGDRAFGDRESVSGFYAVPPLGPLRAPLIGPSESGERHEASEAARAQMSGAKSRRSLQRRHARARGREKPGGSSGLSYGTGPGDAPSLVPSSVTLLEQSSQLGSVRSKHSQGSARRSRTASSVSRSVHVRLRRPAWTVNADHALVVHLQPLEAVVNVPLLARVAAVLFKPAASLESVPGGRLVLASFESELASVSRGLEAAYAQRIALAVDVRVAHPIVILPENVRDARSRVVVIDFGRLTVASRELRSKSDIAAAAKRLQGCAATGSSAAVPASPEISTDAEPLVRPPAANSLLSSPARSSIPSARVAAADDAAHSLRPPGALDEVAHYDTFELRLARAQVYLARGGSLWRNPVDQQQASKGLSLLHDNFCFTALINSSVMPDDPALPRMKISVSVPALHVRLSSAQWDVLQQFVALLPSTPLAAASLRPPSRLNSRGIISALNRDLPTFSGSKLEQWLTSITRVGPMLRMTSDSEAAVSAHGYTTANSTVHRSFNDSAVGYSTATSGPIRRGAPLDNGPRSRRDSQPIATPVADKRAATTAAKLKAARSQRLIRHRRDLDPGRDFAAAAIAEMRHAVYGAPEDAQAFGFALTLSSVSLEILECSMEALEHRWHSELDARVPVNAERTIIVVRASELSLLHTSRAQNVEVVFSLENAGIEDCTSTSASRRMLLSGAAGFRSHAERTIDDTVLLPPITPLLAARFCRKIVLHVSSGDVPARGGTADPRQLLPHTESSIDVACGGLVVNVNEPTIALLLRTFGRQPAVTHGGLNPAAAPPARRGDSADQADPQGRPPGPGPASQSLSISLPAEPAPTSNSYWHTEEVVRVRFQLASLELRFFDGAALPLLVATLGESRVALRSASLLQQQLGLRLEEIAAAGASLGTIPATPLLCRTPLPYGGTPLMRAANSVTAVPPAFHLDEAALQPAVPLPGPSRNHQRSRPAPPAALTHPSLSAQPSQATQPIHCALILPRVTADRGDVNNWHCLSVLSSTPVGSSKASLRVGALRLRTHASTEVEHDESAAAVDIVRMFVPGEQLLVSCEYLDAPLTKFAVVPDFVASTGSANEHDDDDDVSRELPMMFVSDSNTDRSRDVSLSAHFPAGLAISPSLAVGRMDELCERDVRSLADRATMLRVHVRGIAVAIDSTFFARLAVAVKRSTLVNLIALPAVQGVGAVGTYAAPAVRWQSTDVVKRYDVRMDSSAISLSLGAPYPGSARPCAELLLSLRSFSLRNSFIDPSGRGLRSAAPSRGALERCAPPGSWSEALSARAVGVALELRTARAEAVVTPIVLSTDLSCDLEAPAVFTHSASLRPPLWSIADPDEELLALVASRVVLSPIAVRVTPQILAAVVTALKTAGTLSLVDWGPALAAPPHATAVFPTLSRLTMTVELSRVFVSLADDDGVGAIADVELNGVVANVLMRNYAPSATRSLFSLSAVHAEQFSFSVAEMRLANQLATRDPDSDSVILARQVASDQLLQSSSLPPFLSCNYVIAGISGSHSTISFACERPYVIVTPDVIAALLSFLMRPELQYPADGGSAISDLGSNRGADPADPVQLDKVVFCVSIMQPEMWFLPHDNISGATALVVELGESVTLTMSAPSFGDSLVVKACDLSASLCAPSTGLRSRQRIRLVSLTTLEAALSAISPLAVRLGPVQLHASLAELMSTQKLYAALAFVAFRAFPPSTTSGMLDVDIHVSNAEVTLVDRNASNLTVPLVRVAISGLAIYTRVSGHVRIAIDGPDGGFLAHVRDSRSNSWAPLIHRCDYIDAVLSSTETGPCFNLTTHRPGESASVIELDLSILTAETCQRITAGLSLSDSSPAVQPPSLFRLRNDTGLRLAYTLHNAFGASWDLLEQGQDVGISSECELPITLDDYATSPDDNTGLSVALSARGVGDESTQASPLTPPPDGISVTEREVALPRVQLARCGVRELALPFGGHHGVVVAETFSDDRGCLVTRLRSTLLLSNLLDVPVHFEAVCGAAQAWSASVSPGSCVWVPASLADALRLRVRFSIIRGESAFCGEVDGGFSPDSLWGNTPASQHARVPLASAEKNQQPSWRQPPVCVVAELTVGCDAQAAAAVGGDAGTRSTFSATAAVGDAGFNGPSTSAKTADPQTAWVGHASSTLPLAECDPAIFADAVSSAAKKCGLYGVGTLRVLSLHLPLLLTNLLPVSTEIRARDANDPGTADHEVSPEAVAGFGAPKRLSLMSGELLGYLAHACAFEFRPANMRGWSSVVVVGGPTLTTGRSTELGIRRSAAHVLSPADANVSTLALHCIDAAGLSTTVHLETAVTTSGCLRCVLYAPYTFQDRSGLGLQLSWGTPRVSIRAAASIALGSPLPVTDAAGAVVAAVEKPVSTFRSIATTLGNVVLSPLFSTRSGAGGIGAAKTAGSRSDRCGGSSLRRDLDAAASEAPSPWFIERSGLGLAGDDARVDGAFDSSCAPILLLPAVDPSSDLSGVVDRGEWTLGLSCARGSFAEKFSPVEVRSLLACLSHRQRNDEGHGVVSCSMPLTTGIAGGEGCVVSVTASTFLSAQVLGRGRSWGAHDGPAPRPRFHDSVAYRPVSGSPWSWMLARTVVLRAVPRVIVHNATQFPLLVAPRMEDGVPCAITPGGRATLSANSLISDLGRVALRVGLSRSSSSEVSRWSTPVAVDAAPGDGFTDFPFKPTAAAAAGKDPDSVQATWLWLASSAAQLGAHTALRGPDAGGADDPCSDHRVSSPAAAPHMLLLLRSSADELCAYVQPSVRGRGSENPLLLQTDFGCAATVITICAQDTVPLRRVSDPRGDADALAPSFAYSPHVSNMTRRTDNRAFDPKAFIDASAAAPPFRVSNCTQHVVVISQVDVRDSAPSEPSPQGLRLAPCSAVDFCWPNPAASPAARRRFYCWAAIGEELVPLGLLDPDAVGRGVINADLDDNECICVDVQRVAARSSLTDDNTTATSCLQQELLFVSRSTSGGRSARLLSNGDASASPLPIPRVARFSARFSLRVKLGLHTWDGGTCGIRIVPIASLELLDVDARRWVVRQGATGDPWGVAVRLGQLRLCDTRPGAPIPLAFGPSSPQRLLRVEGSTVTAESAPHFDFALKSVVCPENPLLRGAAEGDALSLDVALTVAPTAIGVDEHFFIELTHAILAILSAATPKAPATHAVERGGGENSLFSTPPRAAAVFGQTRGNAAATGEPIMCSANHTPRPPASPRTPRLSTPRQQWAMTRTGAALQQRSGALGRLTGPGSRLATGPRVPPASPRQPAPIALVPTASQSAPFSMHVASLRLSPLRVAVSVVDEAAQRASLSSVALAARCGPVPLSGMLPPWVRETASWLRWATLRCGAPLPVQLDSVSLPPAGFVSHDPVFLGDAFAALFAQHAANPLSVVRANAPLLWAAVSRVFSHSAGASSRESSATVDEMTRSAQDN